MSDIEYDLYVCGIYRGKRTASTNSIMGALAAGRIREGSLLLGMMISELNAIEGVKACARIEAAWGEDKSHSGWGLLGPGGGRLGDPNG